MNDLLPEAAPDGVVRYDGDGHDYAYWLSDSNRVEVCIRVGYGPVTPGMALQNQIIEDRKRRERKRHG